MGEPYIGEIRMFGGDFAPAGWVLCDGRELAVAEYPALYAVIGATYGAGAGTFAVPDLRHVALADDPASGARVPFIMAVAGLVPARARRDPDPDAAGAG